MNILVAYRGVPGSLNWTTGAYLVKAFKLLGHNARPYGNIYQSQDRIGSEIGNPDLLVYLECNDSDPQYVELLSLGCPKVYWDFDTAMHYNFTLTWMQNFDLNFCANKTLASHLPRCKYLPYAVDADVFNPMHLKKDGVAIIGNAFTERKDFADKIGVPIISGIYKEEYVEAINKLKIHIHYFASGGDGLIVARPFETMACETFLLAQNCHVLDELFMPGKHYGVFNSVDECRDLIDYYGKHDDCREEMCRLARLEIVEKHTYLNRARTILARVEQ